MTISELRKRHLALHGTFKKPVEKTKGVVADYLDWNINRMPTEEELQTSYENSGEYLFQVVIPNPNKRHATANNKPYIVREAICSFDMSSLKYQWLIGSDDALFWKPVKVLGWKLLSPLPVFSK